MIEPNYDTILKAKIDYYGETKAAYEFAANEYAKLSVEYNKFVNTLESSSLTQKENDLLNLTAEVWNNFLMLPVQHPDEVNEFRFLLHQLQKSIMYRPQYRIQLNLKH